MPASGPLKRTGEFDSHATTTFSIRESLARRRFKNFLGQANHFLITTLVGLNGVQSGLIDKDDEFHTSWNPKDRERSALRSRDFVLDLAFVRSTDSLDSYLKECRRKPRLLEGHSFIDEFDASEQSPRQRLEIFSRHLRIPDHLIALFEVFAVWRNGRVHHLGHSVCRAGVYERLQQDSTIISQEFSGLDVDLLIDNQKSNKYPTFKEAASALALAHRLVKMIDDELLSVVDFERYITEVLALQLDVKDERGYSTTFNHRVEKIWGNTTKRTAKVERQLAMMGISRVPEDTGVTVQVSIIEKFLHLDSSNAKALITGTS